MPAPWRRQSRKATSPVTAPIPNSMEVKADVQTIDAEIRDDTRTGHTVPACRTDMGRAHWKRTGPGEELAADGLRLPGPIWGHGSIYHMAINAKSRCALRCAGR